MKRPPGQGPLRTATPGPAGQTIASWPSQNLDGSLGRSVPRRRPDIGRCGELSRPAHRMPHLTWLVRCGIRYLPRIVLGGDVVNRRSPVGETVPGPPQVPMVKVNDARCSWGAGCTRWRSRSARPYPAARIPSCYPPSSHPAGCHHRAEHAARRYRMNRHCGQEWWSIARLSIRAGTFCLVELRGLEPLTPCLQSAVSACGAAPDLAADAPGSVRETPRCTGGNGTLMARGYPVAALATTVFKTGVVL